MGLGHMASLRSPDLLPVTPPAGHCPAPTRPGWPAEQVTSRVAELLPFDYQRCSRHEAGHSLGIAVSPVPGAGADGGCVTKGRGLAGRGGPHCQAKRPRPPASCSSPVSLPSEDALEAHSRRSRIVAKPRPPGERKRVKPPVWFFCALAREGPEPSPARPSAHPSGVWETHLLWGPLCRPALPTPTRTRGTRVSRRRRKVHGTSSQGRFLL